MVELVRVYAGLMLFCLITSAGLYFLPRILSRNGVKVMEKILRQVSDVTFVILILAFGGGFLLIVLGYQGLGESVIMGSTVITFGILMPTIFGHSATREKIWKEEDETWKTELAKSQKG